MSVIEVNKTNFDEIVLESNKKVLVDFNAEWCGPCKMLKPVLEKVANEVSDVEFVSVNIDDEEDLAEKYEIASIPCLVLFDNGEEAKRKVGLMSEKDIKKMVEE